MSFSSFFSFIFGVNSCEDEDSSFTVFVSDGYIVIIISIIEWFDPACSCNNTNTSVWRLWNLMMCMRNYE